MHALKESILQYVLFIIFLAALINLYTINKSTTKLSDTIRNSKQSNIIATAEVEYEDKSVWTKDQVLALIVNNKNTLQDKPIIVDGLTINNVTDTFNASLITADYYDREIIYDNDNNLVSIIFTAY